MERRGVVCTCKHCRSLPPGLAPGSSVALTPTPVQTFTYHAVRDKLLSDKFAHPATPRNAGGTFYLLSQWFRLICIENLTLVQKPSAPRGHGYVSRWVRHLLCDSCFHHMSVGSALAALLLASSNDAGVSL